MDMLRQRSAYPTTKQKRRLISFVAQHPQLISGKVSQNFTRRDAQNLWITIATECNSLPGARKTWKQWRKTWQDLRANIKRKQLVRNGEYPSSIDKLTVAEKEALGLKNVISTTTYQDTVEFVAPEDESIQDDFLKLEDKSIHNEFLQLEDKSNQDEFLPAENESIQNNNLNGHNDSALDSEPESPHEVQLKMINRSKLKANKIKSKFMRHSDMSSEILRHSDKSSESITHSDNCAFNCDRLAIQEQRKIQIKEDYLNFKKDYLREKLLLMKEQTEALKGIAKELAK